MSAMEGRCPIATRIPLNPTAKNNYNTYKRRSMLIVKMYENLEHNLQSYSHFILGKKAQGKVKMK